MTSKAEYLKRYMSEGQVEKKKKKRKIPKPNTKLGRSRIVDDDIDMKQLLPGNLENTLEEDVGDNDPTVAGIIDERPEHIQQLEAYQKDGRWKVLADSTEDRLGQRSLEQHNSDSDQSPVRKRYDSDSDQSPARKKRHDSDSDQSPVRRKRYNSDSDQSPARKKRHDSDSDQSPVRRKRHDSDSDQSPARKIRHDSDSDQSPARRKRHDSDQSPVRRKRHDSDSDQSLPRKHQTKKKKRSSDSDDSLSKKVKSTGRRKGIDQSPSSKTNFNSDSDQSPPRKRGKSSDSDQFLPRKNNRDSGSDQSPPRRKYGKSEIIISAEKGKDKMEKTLSGKKAGLSSAKDMRREADILREKEEKAFRQIGDDVSGRNARTVFRKSGKFAKKQEEPTPEEKARKEKQTEKYKEWGKGLKQQEKEKAMIEDTLHEISKPMARYEDDEDLNSMLRQQHRAEDPMAAFIKKKSSGSKTKGKPMYKGPPPPPNRFNIMPGYRWDGVDRSNGFERSIFSKMANKKAVEKMAYEWSTQDM